MLRLLLCLLLAILGAVVGPNILGPRSRAAGARFVYEPPDGFVPKKADRRAEVGSAQVWVEESADRKNFDGSPVDRSADVTRIVLHHSDKEMSVEEKDLAKLAEEMPKAFTGSCNWVHRRHELRTRADGARVGLIEGDCDREIDFGVLGLPSQKVRARKLQLIFPDDEGTSIVTASYPTEQAARWGPLFEATIGKARGVATRAPDVPPATRAGWALASGVLGWLATAIAFRSGGAPRPNAGEGSKNEDRTEEDHEPDEDVS